MNILSFTLLVLIIIFGLLMVGQEIQIYQVAKERCTTPPTPPICQEINEGWRGCLYKALGLQLRTSPIKHEEIFLPLIQNNQGDQP